MNTIAKHIKKNLTSSTLDAGLIGFGVIGAICLIALISGFVGGTII